MMNFALLRAWYNISNWAIPHLSVGPLPAFAQLFVRNYKQL